MLILSSLYVDHHSTNVYTSYYKEFNALSIRLFPNKICQQPSVLQAQGDYLYMPRSTDINLSEGTT